MNKIEGSDTRIDGLINLFDEKKSRVKVNKITKTALENIKELTKKDEWTVESSTKTYEALKKNFKFSFKSLLTSFLYFKLFNYLKFCRLTHKLTHSLERKVAHQRALELLKGCSQENIGEIVKLIEANFVDVNLKDNQGGTVLHYAVFNGYEKEAKALIEKGADVHAKDNEGRTPLHIAASGGHLEIVEALIEKADVNARNKRLETPLHIAASGGHLEIVKALIEKADVNAKDDTGRTPLHYAVSEGYMKITKALIEKEADVHAKDNKGVTVFDVAKSEEMKSLL